MKAIGLALAAAAFFPLISCTVPKLAEPNPYEMPRPTRSDEMLVGIFIYDGCYNTELVASYDVFNHTGAIVEQWNVSPHIQVVTVAPKLSQIQTAEGLRIAPDHSFTDCPPLDVLVIPSGVRFREDILRIDWTRWIAAMSERAKYTISHAWGSFLLAAAGRLEHRKATTFPADSDRMKQVFPNVAVVKDMRFIQDGAVITSSGGIASYEASLSLVKLIYGEKMARSVAGGLLFSPDNLLYSMPK